MTPQGGLMDIYSLTVDFLHVFAWPKSRVKTCSTTGKVEISFKKSTFMTLYSHTARLGGCLERPASRDFGETWSRRRLGVGSARIPTHTCTFTHVYACVQAYSPHNHIHTHIHTHTKTLQHWNPDSHSQLRTYTHKHAHTRAPTYTLISLQFTPCAFSKTYVRM